MCFLVLFLFVNLLLRAQSDSITIAGQFSKTEAVSKVIMKKFGVGSFEIAASPVKNGRFDIKIGKIPSGVYRMQFGNSNSEHIDIIINGRESNLFLEISNNASSPSVNFTNSQENKIWHDYKQKIVQLSQRMNVKDSSSFQKVEEEYMAMSKAFLKKNKNNWAGKMVANQPLRFDLEQLLIPEYRDLHFWDGLDASDASLLNTPIFVDQIFSYVKFYLDPKNSFTDEVRARHFMAGTAAIMERFGKNPETKKFAFQFLASGFQQVGEEQALQFLDENYGDLAEQCMNEADKSAFEMRLASYKATRPGTPIKDFIIKDANGKQQSVKMLAAAKTIIVFYASWCPHCNVEMPKINEWAASHPEVAVVAVSLDKEAGEFQKSSHSYPNLIFHCDFKGWESQPAKDYSVMVTPTFLVFDSDKKIIGKYGSFSKIVASGQMQ